MECRAWGKLYIGGEYAVVEPGNKAVLVGVDSFITVSLEKAYDRGSISSYDNLPIIWKREKDRLVLDRRDNRLSYIMSAIETLEDYALELGRKLDFYNLKVRSQMESSDGRKYGLGSSGAITVATVRLLAQYYEIDLDDLEVFKLASLAQLKVNTSGSMGDIAASVYGGLIAYTSFDRDWVLARRDGSIKDLIASSWPYLEIEKLDWPQGIKLVVGWTKSPASTANLVDKVRDKKVYNSKSYNNFLARNKLIVDSLILAFKKGDLEAIARALGENRRLLLDLERDLGIIIETDKLKDLCNIVESLGGAAKSSGAGGGDCGIAIFKEEASLGDLIKRWELEDIDYLDLSIYERKDDNV